MNQRRWKNKKTLLISLIMLSFLVQLIMAPSVLKAENSTSDFEISYELSPNYIYEGDSFNLKVTVKNNTEKGAEDLQEYKASIEKDCSFYSTEDDGLDKTISWSDNGQIGEVEFNLQHDGGSRNTIQLNITDNSGATVASTEIAITVLSTSSNDEEDDDDDDNDNYSIQDTSTYVPILNFTNSSMLYGSAGERLRVSLKLKNTSSYTARNIRIMPDLSGDSPFTLDSTTAVHNIERLKPDEIETIRYYFDISPDAEEKVYPLTFNFTYYNNYKDYFGGSSAPRSDTVYVKVTNKNTPPRLSIAGVSVISDDKNLPDDVMNTELKISNLGTLPAEDVKVTLLGLENDGFGLHQDSNLKNITQIPGNGQETVRFALLPSSKIGRGNYGLTAKIDYKDQSGNSYSDEHQFFISLEDGVSSNSVPKIILNEYNCEPGIVKAGENFILNLSFLNTSIDKTVSNIKIFFTVPDGGSESSGSVFSPVNSSNTIFIDSIPPKSVYHRTLEFYTIPDAEPKTYTLTANFEYEDENGTQYEATELIGVVVSQQTKIETSEIILPPQVFPGEPVPVSIDFYNTGKAKLSNLMFKLEGDFETQNGSYYVGNFEPGASDYFEGTVIPNSPGSVDGTILISYDDPSGEHVQINKDFTLNVAEMVIPEEIPPAFDSEFNEASGPSFLTWIVSGIILLMLIIVLIVLVKKGIFRKLINRKKGLPLDE